MWDKLFERQLDSIVREGRLVVHMPDGRTLAFGDSAAEPVVIHVHDPALIRKLVLNAELHLGEGYMDEAFTIEGDDLHGLLTLALKNLQRIEDEGREMWHRRIVGGLRTALRRFAQHNPVGRAQRNVAHHYDLSGELYRLFLDEDMQYSCAYFTRPDMTLEEAQAAKKHHIAKKLLIEPGHRVLDIGCGWGGMGLTLARDHGAEVVGVTLSSEQHQVANRRAVEAGLQDRVKFLLQDYRNVTDSFDRIVSVGMFEHVGAPHYREFFRHLRRMLKPDGVALLHTIGRVTPPGATNPWITRYIFPGGYVPAMSEVMAAIEKEGLIVTDIEVLRLHYAETLRHWHDRFMANVDRVREIYDDRFCRMWRYYLVASELTFRHYGQVVFQFQIARKQDAVPLTRDYLYREAAATPAEPAAGAEGGAREGTRGGAKGRRKSPSKPRSRRRSRQPEQV